MTVGWGHYGARGAVMPGQGRVQERPYTPKERAALGGSCYAMGDTTFDVYLNDRAYWRNIPVAVWTYKLGGYQVLKKWLSYRELSVLNRRLSADEVQLFTDIARRIASILLVFSSVRPGADYLQESHLAQSSKTERIVPWSENCNATFHRRF